MKVLITSFRYVNKRGEGKAKAFYRTIMATPGSVLPGPKPKIQIKRPLQVRVTKVWNAGDRASLYKGHAIDSFLAKFLSLHADPNNQEVYFEAKSIYDHARTTDDADAPLRIGMGR